MKQFKVCTAIAFLLFTAASCGDDSSSACLTTTCGDGVLNGDEICDGSQFKEGVKVCPDGLVPKDVTAIKCTDTCGLDFSKACFIMFHSYNTKGVYILISLPASLIMVIPHSVASNLIFINFIKFSTSSGILEKRSFHSDTI